MMEKINGNVVGIPNPITDWNQTDETKADFIKNKPDLNVFANALKETVSGEAIGITDISPIEHNVNVEVSGVEDLSTVKLYKCGSNLFNNDFSLLKNIKYINTSGTETTRMGYEISLPTGTYIMKAYLNPSAASNTAYIYAGTIDANRNYKQKLNLVEATYLPPSTAFTIEEGDVLIIYDGISGHNESKAQGYFSKYDCVLNVGNKALPYEPYIEPIIYDVNADGTVEGVKSLYPSTTLYTDTSGAVIDCTYNKDINKAFAELQNAIIAIGGLE